MSGYEKMEKILDEIADKTIELVEACVEERLNEYCRWLSDQKLVDCNTNYVEDFLRETT